MMDDITTLDKNNIWITGTFFLFLNISAIFNMGGRGAYSITVAGQQGATNVTLLSSADWSFISPPESVQ